MALKTQTATLPLAPGNNQTRPTNADTLLELKRKIPEFHLDAEGIDVVIQGSRNRTVLRPADDLIHARKRGYTSGTPNGQKISCTLEELGLEYTVHKIDISRNVQKEPWFLEINRMPQSNVQPVTSTMLLANGRIPAIVDNSTSTPQRVFEGGAIMQYLTERYDKQHHLSFPHDSAEYWESISWLTWMQSGIGPMQGQANHFFRYAPTKIDYAIQRYQTETKRLYQILEGRLKTQQKAGQGLWLVGNKFSIADLSCFSWVNWAEWAGIELAPYPLIEQWLETIQKRPAIEKGVNVPDKFEMKEKMKTKEGEEEYAKHHSNWVMKGMEDDQQKHK